MFRNVITLRIILRNETTFRKITTCSKLQIPKKSMVKFCLKRNAKLQK